MNGCWLWMQSARSSLCVNALLESLERGQADIFFKSVDINTFVQFR